MSMTEQVAPRSPPAPPPPAPPQGETCEMRAYRAMVAEIARAADGRVIVNRSEAHAAVVIEHIFRSAKNEIDILTGQLYEPIYSAPGVVQAAIDFLSSRPDGKVRIISEKPINESHPLIAALTKIRPSGIDRRVMTEEMEKQTPFHFAVADERCFRFEPDKKSFEAYGQFGEPGLGAKLKTTFDRLSAGLPRHE